MVPLDGAARGSGRTRAPASGAAAAPPLVSGVGLLRWLAASRRERERKGKLKGRDGGAAISGPLGRLKRLRRVEGERER
jgi:hypothetical protein